MTTGIVTTKNIYTLPVVANQSMPSVGSIEIIEALKSPKVAELAPYQVGKKLNDAITKAFYHLGYKKLELEEEIALQSYLADFLKTEKMYQAVCIDEVVIAIKRGADRQYGEFFGINPATITGWVKAYIQSEARSSAKLMLLQAEEQMKAPKPEPTPQEQWENCVARLRVLYSNFLSGILIQPVEATFYFKILRRSRIINFDQSRRDKLKAKALIEIKNEANPKRATSKDERRRMTAAFAILTDNGSEDPQVISRAMALGLIEWFDDLKAFGRTIDEAVNEEF
jgi:hypothetical protein